MCASPRTPPAERTAFEKALAQATCEIDRIVQAIRGIISDAEAGKRLPDLRQRRDLLEAELAAIAPAPAAIAAALIQPGGVKTTRGGNC